MRERVELGGGQLTIDAAEARGTTIEAILPLSEQRPCSGADAMAKDSPEPEPQVTAGSDRGDGGRHRVRSSRGGTGRVGPCPARPLRNRPHRAARDPLLVLAALLAVLSVPASVERLSARHGGLP